MPQNDEAVVLERKPFPDGPKHPCLTTVLKPVIEDKSLGVARDQISAPT